MFYSAGPWMTAFLISNIMIESFQLFPLTFIESCFDQSYKSLFSVIYPFAEFKLECLTPGKHFYPRLTLHNKAPEAVFLVVCDPSMNEL
jgi:hypothetical protein